MNTAFVALGANIGDPTATVLAAFAALANLPESRVTRCSSLYRTAPVGLRNQPDFINAVAVLETTLPPESPLAELAPGMTLPRRGKLAAWLPAVANQGITRL